MPNYHPWVTMAIMVGLVSSSVNYSGHSSDKFKKNFRDADSSFDFQNLLIHQYHLSPV